MLWFGKKFLVLWFEKILAKFKYCLEIKNSSDAFSIKAKTPVKIFSWLFLINLVALIISILMLQMWFKIMKFKTFNKFFSRAIII